MTIMDWSVGGREEGAGLAFQACPKCGKCWIFERHFCPNCGAAEPQKRQATGAGRVYAVTRVERAPTAELKALAPYTIVLVDLAEGVRVMAHAAPELAIGARVRATYRAFGARLIPYFVATE